MALARAVLRKAREDNPNAVPRGGVAIFSLEMSCDQLATRLLAEESRISGDNLREYRRRVDRIRKDSA